MRLDVYGKKQARIPNGNFLNYDAVIRSKLPVPDYLTPTPQKDLIVKGYSLTAWIWYSLEAVWASENPMDAMQTTCVNK